MLWEVAGSGEVEKLSSLLQDIPKDQVVIEISKWDGIGNPLYRAAQYGHTECVKLLLEAKADPNKGDKEGRTAAYLAAMHPSCSAQYVNK